MLLTLIAWIYISLVSLAWGCWLLRATRNVEVVKGMGPLYIALFAGLAVTGILSLYLSLFTGLSLYAHLIISIPAACFYCFSNNRRQVKAYWEELKSNQSFATLLLGIGGLVMVLAISSHTIIHPDTLRYHAQAVLWMEKLPIVPGTAQIDIHLGLQSWYFGVLALFRFSFLSDHPYIFVNGCVVAWFIFFMADRLGNSLKQNELPAFWGWLLLLLFCLLSWTQIRLTAASASPDFIGALYTWAAFYMFRQAWNQQERAKQFLVLFFCCAAFSIKLSAIVVLLLACCIVVSALSQKRFRTFSLYLITGLICIIPLITRNIISTGYPLFPAAIADLFHTETKLRPEAITSWQHYITAYARLEAEDYEAAEAIFQYSPGQWIPGWWKRISPVDKGLLVSIIVFALLNLVTIKNQRRQSADWIILLVSLAGSIFWFMNAPDPRFGTAFLIPLAYSLMSGCTYVFPVDVKATWNKAAVIVIAFAVSAYTLYRFANFFEPRQLIFPGGIQKTEYKEISCQGMKMSVAAGGDNCGMAPLPCLKKNCDSIIVMENLSGFKSR